MDTLTTVTELIQKAQQGNTSALQQFYQMHEAFKPFQDWTEPTLSNDPKDWDLRIPADIRNAFITIQRRIGVKRFLPQMQAVNDAKLWDAVQHWVARYDELITSKPD